MQNTSKTKPYLIYTLFIASIFCIKLSAAEEINHYTAEEATLLYKDAKLKQDMYRVCELGPDIGQHYKNSAQQLANHLRKLGAPVPVCRIPLTPTISQKSPRDPCVDSIYA